MIAPSEIKDKATKKYSAYLQSIVEDTTIIPLVIRGNKRPSADTVLFERELTELINHAKEKIGYGYSIEYQTVKTKNHGQQDIPTAISFESEQDFLKFVRKEKETEKFKNDYQRILAEFPELKDWVLKYPLKVIENNWDGLLKVCTYFKRNPKPQLYIRELPIQVHTKFIEQNKGILRELLDIIIAESVNIGEKEFEKRYNLCYDEPLVRFRILDISVSQKHFHGIVDLSLPISQFRLLDIPISTVYIVENKMNMLTFPLKADCIVIWGHGFGVDILKDVEWLNDKNVYYWGDLDAHGFQILSEIRSRLPHVKSFLMDRGTFDRFYDNEEGAKTNVEKPLCLTTEENDMFLYLKEYNMRLEQEKIPHDYEVEMIP